MKPFILILLFLLAVSALPAQSNPFLSQDSAESPKGGPALSSPGLLPVFSRSTPFMNELITIQRNLREKMGSILEDTKERKGTFPLLVFLAFSLLYGAAHAVGPGHRKVMLVSYFISRDSRIHEGLLVALSLAVIHGGTAIVLISVVKLIMQRVSLQRVDSLGAWLEFYTLLALIVLGLILLVLKIIELTRGGHKHEGRHREARLSGAKQKARLSVIIASGSIPCAGAVLVLLFANSLDVFGLGVLSVLFMSLGMALTLSAVVVITLLLKEGVYRLIEKSERLARILHDSFEIAGDVLIAGFAFLMLLPYIAG